MPGKIILYIFLSFINLNSLAQRVYKSNSVLSQGEWFEFSVKEAGIYKIDMVFLGSLGVNTQNISSASIRLFGNGGEMLAEANNISRSDDLEENAIMLVDGGDGVLNGSDYFLFYASGPHSWLKDSTNKLFKHQQNIYSDKSFYFFTIGGNGKRIQNVNNSQATNISINSFNDRYYHELDTVNFLASGKEWYGEEFSNMPGRSLSRNFDFNIPNILNNSAATLVTNCIARSVGASSRFDVKLNNQLLQQINVLPVGSSQYNLFAQQATASASTVVSQNNIFVGYSFVPNSFNAQGWLNSFEFFSRRNLSMNGINQLLFRDWLSVANGNIGEFSISNTNTSLQVWDITNPLNPANMQGNFSNGTFRFVNNCNRLREYICFTGTEFLRPGSIGKISNQDLHNSSPADYLIVTYSSLLTQANRLAQFHQQKNNYRVKVVTAEQVFNEFGSGSPDPTSVRDFIKMYFDKYQNQPQNKLKYVLLFGDASYDYKNRITGNTNFLPAYESVISLDPLSTYTSDDFFGFLDDNEDINSAIVTNLLDVGIGRVPAKNETEAKNFVEKVLAYYDSKSFGPWRNIYTIIADDEDQNLHLQDAEIFSTTVSTTDSALNINKIYLDAYLQQNGSGIDTYPQANDAVNNTTNTGTLIWNYSGHGGFRRLAEEVILDQTIIDRWNNPYRLPLFVTATCDFAPYDNPLISSIGENILLRPNTGGIALMTTTRLVFSSSNRLLNNNYLSTALLPDVTGNYKTLGEAVMITKNLTYQSSGDFINNRKFTLLGDPAMRLGFPQLNVKVVSINGHATTQTDTLSATENITLDAEITDLSGNLQAGFNGFVYTSIYDKPQQVTTKANDPSSPAVSFSSQNVFLFKGKNTVSAGRFSLNFKVPKDINFQFGNGKMTFYANDSTKDAGGYFNDFIIGGSGTGTSNDIFGPEIKAWLNDEKFVNGSITNQSPLLIVKLKDSSGINTTGSAIGHDIVAVLDNNNNNFFILNDFFESDLDNYGQGVLRFQLPFLEQGHHSLKIKAWDNLNNSSEYILEFLVENNEELVLTRVLNYPNPFTTKTQFWFEHNRPGQNLQVKIEVFTVTGKIIKSLSQTINTEGTRSCEVEWDGRDEYGTKVGRGVYLYRLKITSPDNHKKQTIGKLVIF
ncbi:MAG: type IX secretion system sortase PorU [Bacteroidetes bacterium]|nr:MAG: type IX secretion system sortase PorU [Bacteroidota bacterium]